MHSVCSTAASVADKHMLADLLHGHERKVWGDGAYQGGVQYPSASPYVTSVGGTELTPDKTRRLWIEKPWVTPADPPTQGSSSGCSAYENKPSWQKDKGCTGPSTN